MAGTVEMLRVLLEDAKKPPLQRLRDLVHAFVRSERDEARFVTDVSGPHQRWSVFANSRLQQEASA